METSTNRQAATSIILTLAVISLGWYLMLLLDPANIGQPVAYAMLLVGEVIGMVQLLGVWATIITGKPEKTPYEVIAARTALARNPAIAGTVVAFITVAGEPVDIVTRTIRATQNIRFPHQTWVLDDGKSDELRAVAKELGVGYLRRADRTGWKGGNMNNAIRTVPCDFFAIFDCDYVPKAEFLDVILPWLMADKEVAFVQTQQCFSNCESFVGGGSSEMQEIFYTHIQPAKNRFNAAFAVGTNTVYRAQAVRDLGGMHEKSHSEDIWTSFLLHEQGWKSVYLPDRLAIGLAPETVEAYFRQQFRWATGGYEILFRGRPLGRKGFTLDQKLQYFHTSLFFLSGFSVFIFFVLPLCYVYFGWKPLAVSAGAPVWIGHFLPYFVMMQISVMHLLGRWPKWRTYVISLGAFWAHIMACVAVATGLKVKWTASGVKLSNIDHVKAIMPHLLLGLLSAAAIPVLLLSQRNMGLNVLMSGWLLLNTAFLFSICRNAFPTNESVPTHAPEALPA